jgi:hypothetical protein
VKKFLLIALALGINPAQAVTYSYVCKDHGKKYPLTLDDVRNTLSWKGEVYTIKQVEDCGRYGWHAQKDGAGFDFCTATQGYADFELNGSKIVCDMKR